MRSGSRHVSKEGLEVSDILFCTETLSPALLLVALYSYETASNDSGGGPAL